MTDSLRDQLLGLGFKPAPTPERAPVRRADGVPGGRAKPDRARSGAPVAARSKADKSGPRDQRPRGADHARRAPAAGKPRTREDIDLAKAYAIRAQREKDERLKAEQARQDEARLRREARARLAELVKDQSLNASDADIARHFPYGGKIKRIYVTQAQLQALNAGELGVLQMDGRYLLVSAALLAQAEAIFPPAVALKVDPDAPVQEDPYADARFQVPDDLVW